MTKTLTLDNPNHVLLDSSHTVMRPAVHNFTQALDRIVVHFLLYHDSIRHSSRECAAQIHSDSMKKLISSTELGYDCLKELVTFVRRSSIQSEAQVNEQAQPIPIKISLINLGLHLRFDSFRQMLSIRSIIHLVNV